MKNYANKLCRIVKEVAQGHRRTRTNKCLTGLEPEVPDCEATGVDTEVADDFVT